MKRKIINTVACLFAALLVFPFSNTGKVFAENENLIIDGGFENVSIDKSGIVPKVTYHGDEDDWDFNNCKIMYIEGSDDDCEIKNESGTVSSFSAISRIKSDDYVLPAGNYMAGFYFYNTKPVIITVSLVNTATSEEITETLDVAEINASYIQAEFEFTVNDPAVYQFKVIAEKNSTSKTFYVHFDNFYMYAVGGGEEPAEESQEETFPDVFTADGAGLRVYADAGLRFQGYVKKSFYDTCRIENDVVETGIIIVPTDFLSDCEFTVEALTAAGKPKQICVASDMTEVAYQVGEETENYYMFYCALVGIRPYNLDREFSARTFLRYKNGNCAYTYVYGDYSETDNSRSVCGVANLAYADIDKYNERIQAAIQYFISAVAETENEPVEHQGDVYEYAFSVGKGCFTLEYDRNNFTLSDVSVTVDGKAADFSNGYIILDDEAEITVRVTATGSSASGFSLKAKVYKTDR